MPFVIGWWDSSLLFLGVKLGKSWTLLSRPSRAKNPCWQDKERAACVYHRQWSEKRMIKVVFINLRRIELDVLTGVKYKPEDSLQKKKIAEVSCMRKYWFCKSARRVSWDLDPRLNGSFLTFIRILQRYPNISLQLDINGRMDLSRYTDLRSNARVWIPLCQRTSKSLKSLARVHKKHWQSTSRAWKLSKRNVTGWWLRWMPWLRARNRLRQRFCLDLNGYVFWSSCKQVKEKADQVIQDMHEQARLYHEKVLARKREREIIISLS